MATKKGKKSETKKSSSLDKLREAFNNSGGNSNVRWWKPDYGDTVIRILPEIDPDDLFFLETARHYVNGVWYYCLHYKKDEETGKSCRCPICDSRKRLFRTGEKPLIKIAKEIKAKLQYLMNMVVRKSEDPNAVRVWGPGVKIWKKMVKDMLDDDLEITDVHDGYDFQVSKVEGARAENGQVFPDYGASKIKRRSSPLAETDEEINEILENRTDLNSIPKFESEETLQRAIDDYIKLLTKATDEEFYEEEKVETKSTGKTKASSSKTEAFKAKLKAQLSNED